MLQPRMHEVADHSKGLKPYMYLFAVNHVANSFIDHHGTTSTDPTHVSNANVRPIKISSRSAGSVITSPQNVNAIGYIRCSKFLLA